MSCPAPGSDEFRCALITHLPGLSTFAVKGRPLFREWTDGAQRTLRPDPEYGSEKKIMEAVEKDMRPSPDQQHQRDLAFYDCLGPEDPERPCQKDGCRRGTARHSVFCRKHHFEQMERRECPFDH
jgi:hypothetical protein